MLSNILNKIETLYFYIDFIFNKQALTYIRLEQNRIGDSGAQCLGEALKVNKVNDVLFISHSQVQTPRLDVHRDVYVKDCSGIYHLF